MNPVKISVVFALLASLAFGEATQTELEDSYRAIDNRATIKTAFTRQERQKLFNSASQNSVASLDVLDKYDPTGEVGFCFGRAMAVDLIARKSGLSKHSARKLFMIGDLRSGSQPEWRFHVTTLVKGEEDDAWYAVDPIMTAPLASGTPLKMEKWIEIVRKTWDRNRPGKIYFANAYMVNPDTVIPDLRVVPDPKKEKGERVIEISFNPKDKTGFAPFTVGSQVYYEVSEPSQAEYFTQVYELTQEDRFRFLDLEINTQRYAFNNYFVDLLKDLSHADSH